MKSVILPKHPAHRRRPPEAVRDAVPRLLDRRPVDEETIPRSAVSDVRSLTGALLDRMHELLERNTEGTLTEVERESLETLVQMAQFGQLIASALDAQTEAAAAR